MFILSLLNDISGSSFFPIGANQSVGGHSPFSTYNFNNTTTEKLYATWSGAAGIDTDAVVEKNLDKLFFTYGSDKSNKFKAKKKLTIDKLKKSENPPIMLGMSTSQVESIMGPPKDVISSGSQKQNQLWIYEFSNRDKISLTFINYSLYKIGDD